MISVETIPGMMGGVLKESVECEFKYDIFNIW
jgi:hypothetical protein